MEFLTWLEESGIGRWVTESPSLFAYTGLLSLHAFGLAFAAGVSTAIDLRILGVAPELPLGPMARLFPVIWTAFAVNALSGGLLLVGNATKDLVNPVFYIKMILVVLGAVSARKIQKLVCCDPTSLNTSPPRQVRLLATASLAIWAGAIVAGRLVEYPNLFHF